MIQSKSQIDFFKLKIKNFKYYYFIFLIIFSLLCCLTTKVKAQSYVASTARNTTSCQIIDPSAPDSNCQWPIKTLWTGYNRWDTYGLGEFFPAYVETPEEAIALTHDTLTRYYTNSSTSTICSNSHCYFNSIPIYQLAQLINADEENFITDYYNSVGSSNYSLDIFGISRAPFCNPGYYAREDLDISHLYLILVCVSSHTLNINLQYPESSDMTNTEGKCVSCNPVNLMDLNKQDEIIDLQNHSPYPIIWSRHWNGRLQKWVFNYDRSIDIPPLDILSGVMGSQTTIKIVLKRPDGQYFPFLGTKDSSGNWTWVPKLDNSNWDALILGKLTSAPDLSSFTFKTYKGETETYNNKGQLTELSDSHNIPLTFSYDNLDRLIRIQDASSRYLNITYPDVTTSQTVMNINNQSVVNTQTPQLNITGIYDPSQPGMSVASKVQLSLDPETVTDGTHSIGYVYNENALDTTDSTPPVLLFQVIKPNGKVLTYNYDQYNNFTGLTDESGDRYSTYAYNTSHQVISTFHGQNHETVQYAVNGSSTNKMTLPNGQSAFFGLNSNTNKVNYQNIPCYYCGGLQEKSVSYDPSGNPTSLTDFNNNTQTRIYDQLRGVPTSITEASGTSLAQTTTYQWDSRFLKPTLITQSVALGTGLGTKTTENDYDANGNLTRTADTITNTNNFYAYYHKDFTYNNFGEILTSKDELGHVSNFTYDAQGNLTSQTNPLNQTTLYGGYDSSGNLGWVQDANGLTTKFTYPAIFHLSNQAYPSSLI